MLRESPEFAPYTTPLDSLTAAARDDARIAMRLVAREQRTTVKGQIRIEPRRSTKAALDALTEPPKSNGRQILKGEKREHVVKRVAATLDDSRLSPFEFEGVMRHGIRAGLCLDGHQWTDADSEAERVVAEALDKLHAHRPSYNEGQREYSVGPDYCAWCNCQLEDEAHRGRHMSYCSDICAKRALIQRDLYAHRKESHAYRKAIDTISRSRAVKVECEECGKSFGAVGGEGRFCSNKCRGAHHSRVMALPDQTCPTCQQNFHPAKRGAVYCSIQCSADAKAKPLLARPCEHCGTSFTPDRHGGPGRFCSRRCASEHGPDKYIVRCCDWCGTAYATSDPRSLTCSSRCGQTKRKHAFGQTPTLLAAHIFDHFVSIPASNAIGEEHRHAT